MIVQQTKRHTKGRHFFKKTDKLRTLSEKGGGGPAMSEVLSEISDDYKFVYFTLSHDKEVHISEQNHQNQKLSAGSDMDF